MSVFYFSNTVIVYLFKINLYEGIFKNVLRIYKKSCFILMSNKSLKCFLGDSYALVLVRNNDTHRVGLAQSVACPPLAR